MISLRSQTTKRLLSYFFLNPHENLYFNEICRKLNLDKRNLSKKLKELEIEGLFDAQERGNNKVYRLNKRYPLYNEYKKIILKTIGVENELKNISAKIRGIKKLIIYGSYAKNKMDSFSDIDILVVGDHSITDLQKKLSKLQKEINREINVLNMDEKEYKKRIQENDSFLKKILREKKINIVL